MMIAKLFESDVYYNALEGPVVFHTDLQPRMAISSSGNVGIGSTIHMPDNITFTQNSAEMLRIAEDGFYIRGEKVPVDENEAKTVYEAFKSWLTWVSLTRNYT